MRQAATINRLGAAALDRDEVDRLRHVAHENAINAATARAEKAERELAECRNSRQREHDLRVTLAGELESFKIRYQDEVNARVDAENDRDTLRTGYVSELRKAKAELATARIAALALKQPSSPSSASAEEKP